MLRGTAGARAPGQRPPVERVPHGQRHEHLTDLAVRLVRSGVTNRRRSNGRWWPSTKLSATSNRRRCRCTSRKIAKWAASSDIAKREGERQAEQTPAEPKKRTKRAIPTAPERTHRSPTCATSSRVAGGLPQVVRVEEVIRFGSSSTDAMEIRLSNGMRVEFERQGDVMVPKVWQSNWTDGHVRDRPPVQPEDLRARRCVVGAVRDLDDDRRTAFRG